MTKLEKYILKTFGTTAGASFDTCWQYASSHFGSGSTPISKEVLLYSFISLEEKDLLEIKWQNDCIKEVGITTKGLAYLFEYPDLENLEDPLRLEREGRRLSYISIGIAAFGACLSVLSLLFSLLR